MNRRWMARDEIAEIWDDLGKKACLAGGPAGNTDLAHKYWKTAANIRATEKLENPLGSRT